MSTIKTALLFGLLFAITSATPTKRSVCNAGYRTIDGKQYTISCGLDRPGNDYDLLQTSFDHCATTCAADSRCATAQYAEDVGFCYLKTVANAAVRKSGVDTIDHGKACKSNTTAILSGVQCKISCGVDRAGGDYSQAYLGNYLACAEACAADSKCLTAQYKEDNGYCYFKSVVNNAIASSVVDSIVCDRGSSTSTSTTKSGSVTSTSTTTSASSTATGAKIGQSCVYNRDCASNYCTLTNYCGPTPNTYSCGRNEDCQSGYCDFQSYGYGYCKDAPTS